MENKDSQQYEHNEKSMENMIDSPQRYLETVDSDEENDFQDEKETEEPREDEYDPLLSDHDEDESDENNFNLLNNITNDWNIYQIKENPKTRNCLVNNYKDSMPKYHGPKVGPINIPDNVHTPGQYFKLFFDSSIVASFVSATNVYGIRKYKTSWTEVTSIIVYKLFAVLIYMGIVKQPVQRSHWSKNEKFRSSWVNRQLSRCVFERVWSSFHFEDVTNLTQIEREKKTKNNPFWQVSNFLSALALNFNTFFQCDRLLDIDEMCIFFKGRHKCRCYNPNKPSKWHLKAFCLNDATSGYLHDFYMYQGSSETRPTGMSATTYPLWQLLQSGRYDNNGHILFTDNWYTSLDAAYHCFQRGINYVGTIKTNRKSLPKNAIFPKKGKNKRTRGEMLGMTMQNEDGFNLYFTSWQDNKPVHILSTYPSYKKPYQRNSKVDDKFVSLNLWRPTVIGDYNKGMGGTDLCDQKVSYYCYDHASIKWTHRIYTHFIIVAAFNAHILYDWHRQNKITLLKFLEMVIEEITKEEINEVDSDKVGNNNKFYENENENENEKEEEEESYDDEKPSIKRRRLGQWSKQKTRLEGSHTPLIVSSKNPDLRGKCILCKKKTPLKCVECGVFLHAGDNNTGERDSCWYIFHNNKILEKKSKSDDEKNSKIQKKKSR